MAAVGIVLSCPQSVRLALCGQRRTREPIVSKKQGRGANQKQEGRSARSEGHPCQFSAFERNKKYTFLWGHCIGRLFRDDHDDLTCLGVYFNDRCTRFGLTQQAEPQPDNEEHELKVAAINEEIKKIKDQIEVLRAKIDEANEARRGQGVSSVLLVCSISLPVFVF